MSPTGERVAGPLVRADLPNPLPLSRTGIVGIDRLGEDGLKTSFHDIADKKDPRRLLHQKGPAQLGGGRIQPGTDRQFTLSERRARAVQDDYLHLALVLTKMSAVAGALANRLVLVRADLTNPFLLSRTDIVGLDRLVGDGSVNSESTTRIGRDWGNG